MPLYSLSSEFVRFQQGMRQFSLKSAIPQQLDRTYQAFVKSLKVFKQESAAAFASKYHLHSSSEDTLQVQIIGYAKVFRTLFPALQIESQEFSFQLKNRKMNPFELQWKLIQNYFLYHPHELNNELERIFSEQLLSYEKRSLRIKALLVAGAKISKLVVQAALLHEDIRFFQLLNKAGYTPQHDDLHVLLNIKVWEKRKNRVIELIQLGIDLQFFPVRMALHSKDLNFFEVLIQNNYRPNSFDWMLVCQMHDLGKAILYFGKLKTEGYVFSSSDCSSILSHYSSHSYFKLKELIDLICPSPETRSAILQELSIFPPNSQSATSNMPKIKENAQLDNPQNPQEIANSLLKMKSGEISKFPERQKIDSEVIRALINAGFKRWELVLKGNSNDSKGAKGTYSLQVQDIQYAIQKKVSYSVLDLFLHCKQNVPERCLFEEVILHHPTAGYFQALIQAGYKIQRGDVHFALKNKASYATIHALLNFGMARHSGSNGEFVFIQEKAGYIPDDQDLEFARRQSCEAIVVKLIQDHLSRTCTSE
jgi:hypothetical protein